jgi:hypothetical protein
LRLSITSYSERIFHMRRRKCRKPSRTISTGRQGLPLSNWKQSTPERLGFLLACNASRATND